MFHIFYLRYKYFVHFCTFQFSINAWTSTVYQLHNNTKRHHIHVYLFIDKYILSLITIQCERLSRNLHEASWPFIRSFLSLSTLKVACVPTCEAEFLFSTFYHVPLHYFPEEIRCLALIWIHHYIHVFKGNTERKTNKRRSYSGGGVYVSVITVLRGFFWSIDRISCFCPK